MSVTSNEYLTIIQAVLSKVGTGQETATHKAAELGERRRQRRAEKHDATEAALRKAEEEGVDLDEVDGSGAEGRITVRDVEKAASG